jgi:hypothetical protein
MLRPAFILATVLATAATSGHAQAQHQHRHPRGAKIVMNGTLVDPVCAFAQQLADSAQAQCSRQHPERGFQPALLVDSELYVLAFDRDAISRAGAVQALVGQQVKVDGTVYPAANAYLIVVDSIRLAQP